jgi:hypothetical protein
MVGTIKEYPATLHSRIFGYFKMKVLKTIIGHIRLILEMIKFRKTFDLGLHRSDVVNQSISICKNIFIC